MKRNVVRHYDEKYASESDTGTLEALAPSETPANRYEACLSAIPPRFRGGDILEIGAGSGVVARSLIDVGLSFDTYTVSELSKTRLEGLQTRLDDPRIRTLALDIEDDALDISDRYDAVIMVALIEHLFDPLRAMQRVHDMLRPGGFALIDTPNAAKYTRRLKLLFGRFPATASRDEGLTTYDGRPVDLYDEGHLHYFTYRSLTRMLIDRCGFSRVEKIPYTTPPKIIGRQFDYTLAKLRPELFAELCLVAYA